MRAFGVAGGSIDALMGFEMLYGCVSSKTQGTVEVATENTDDEGLIMPLALPLMAHIGGMLLATISTQLTLGGIRTFYS